MTDDEKALCAPVTCNQEQADALGNLEETLTIWINRAREACQKRYPGYESMDDYAMLEKARDELLLIISGVASGFEAVDAEVAGPVEKVVDRCGECEHWRPRPEGHGACRHPEATIVLKKQVIRYDAAPYYLCPRSKTR